MQMAVSNEPGSKMTMQERQSSVKAPCRSNVIKAWIKLVWNLRLQMTEITCMIHA